jgi:NADPH-dependent curcumin reductase CurA
VANRQIVLKEKPSGKLTPEHFALREVPVPTPGPGEVLARTVLLSLDAANRAWMQGRTYTDPVESGDVMHGFTLARVEASNDPAFKPGDLVEAMNGWQDYAVHKPRALAKVAPVKPLSHAMSVLGVTGKTAYFGMLEIGRPKPGETVLVSAAAGAVGSIAAQIAKMQGARVVGLAGSDAKCQWLTRECGIDVAINYKTGALPKLLRQHCPNGIDVYFDNVGGDIFEAALFQMNARGRVVCCGAVSQYDVATPTAGPRGVPGLIVVKRLKLEGFIVMDYYNKRAEAERRLAEWVREGRLKVAEDIVEGLERAPEALCGLLAGENLGKRMVRVVPEA